MLQSQCTPLEIAALNGHANVVDMLLQRNVNVHHMDAVS